jgi:hypothetical protein
MSHLWKRPKNKRSPLKIPTTEYRKKRIRQKGGFDDSYYTKQDIKNMSDVHRCWHCKEYLKPAMFNHRTGEIMMSCDTDDCIGNVDVSERRRQKLLKKAGARRVDAKLTMDFKQLLFGRDLSRMGAVKDRIW